VDVGEETDAVIRLVNIPVSLFRALLYPGAALPVRPSVHPSIQLALFPSDRDPFLHNCPCLFVSEPRTPFLSPAPPFFFIPCVSFYLPRSARILIPYPMGVFCSRAPGGLGSVNRDECGCSAVVAAAAAAFGVGGRC